VSVAALPAWVDPLEDRIEIDGRPVAVVKRAAPKRTYVVLNKPRRVISTTRDPQGRTDVLDLVNLPQRLYPVGRLDADSSGLILLTNDGELANRLTHPRYEVPKLYHVTVRGRLTAQDLEHLKEGLYLAHRSASAQKPQAKKATVARVKLLGYTANRAGESRSRLALTLREGQNRQIRRLLARLGHKVQRLERVAIGPIRVKGLAAGQWRPLTGTERRQLRRAAGLEAREAQTSRKPITGASRPPASGDAR
jgi:pseudouridine synthase